MYRANYLLAVLAAMEICITVAGGSGTKVSAKERIYFDFEKTVLPWTAAADLPFVNVGLERHTGENGCTYPKGNAFANLKLSTERVTGTTWLAARFTGNGHQYVRLSVSARDTGECAQCTPVAYFGPNKPLRGVSFRPLMPVDDSMQVDGKWSAYRAEGSTDLKGDLYIAVGWKSNAEADPDSTSPWRNEVLVDRTIMGRAPKTSSMGFDCIEAEVFPAP